MSNSTHEENERTGGLAGLGAGAVTGASIGTMLIPIPVVGTFAGALVGGVLGSKVGKTVGGALLDALTSADGSAPQPAAAQPAPSADLLNQLERLGKLRSEGLISEQEFAAAKARLLGL